jgi:hypothetical protein
MPGLPGTPGLVYYGRPILILLFYFRWLALAGFLVARSSLAGLQCHACRWPFALPFNHSGAWLRFLPVNPAGQGWKAVNPEKQVIPEAN